MDSKDTQHSSDQTSVMSKEESKGPWHCLKCPSERKPIKQRRHHRCKGDFVACTGAQTCELCKPRLRDPQGRRQKHLIVKCPYCQAKKRSDKMTAHMTGCKSRPKDGAASLAPQSLKDEDSYRADDTVSQFSQFQNASSDEEEIGQKRAPPVGVEQLEQAIKKPPVPLFSQGVGLKKTEQKHSSLTELLFKQATEQRDTQERHIISTAQQLEAENEHYLDQLAQSTIDKMSRKFQARSQFLAQGLKDFRKDIEVKEQQQYARETFSDCEESAVEKAMALIGNNCHPSSKVVEQKLNLWSDTVILFMKSAGLEPNKIQMAIAMATAYMTLAPGQKGSVKNQMIVVPAAKGKTRISMATALCLLKKQVSTDKIVIVYPSELLKKQDEKAWLQAEQLFIENNATLERVVGLKAAVDVSNKQTVLLFDEADKLLVDDLGKAPSNCRACIGFTATIPNHEQEACFEARWLKHQNFSIMSSFGYEYQQKVIECEVPDVAAFFDQSRAPAKLVWCSSDEVTIQKVLDQAFEKGFLGLVDCEDLKTLRSMEGKCMIVTKEELMRGIDYRLKGTTGRAADGIDLLIMRSFSSLRAVEQGLSRVGRYNEPSVRFKLSNVDLVDRKAEEQLNMRISHLVK